MFYLGTMKEAPVSVNCNLPSGIFFMVNIWEASSHDDEVGTLGSFIVGLEILEPSFPAIIFFPVW